ncbi:MAG TPA: hypothetical protein VG934_03470 [Candidatus Paceibacterota bacterium]|nr:hypothetical protein [Candidatus Paceibacterota bacterium]
MEGQSTWRDTLLRTVALIGLILVLLLGAWGIILLAFNLSSVVSTVGGSVVSLVTGNGSSAPAQESLAISTPTAVTSGTPVTISWNHTNASGQYSYSLSYQCQSGLSLKAPTPAGQYQTVPCATPFNYVGATQSMTVIPAISGSAPVAASFVVSATKLDDGTVTASASTNVTVNPASAAPSQTGNSGSTSTGTASNGGTYIPAAHTTTLYGYPDLSVSIISVTQLPTFAYPGRTQVQFQVSNVGTTIARAGWNFTAQLPLQAPYNQYTSQTQQALYPGDKIVYTLTFDNQSSYNQNQVCTLQYPNYNCNNGYNQYPYTYSQSQTYPYNYNQYGSYQTCYSYNGYQNVATPCLDSNGNIIYQNNSTYPYNYNQNYGYQYPSYGRTVTITVDPQNYILESNEANNTVTTQAF